MKGLFITRGVDQQFQLFVDPSTDPHELLRQMTEGVTVRVSDISSSWARLPSRRRRQSRSSGLRPMTKANGECR